MEEMTYGWNLEMQLKAIQLGLRIQEIPVAYRRRSGGVSKVSGRCARVVGDGEADLHRVSAGAAEVQEGGAELMEPLIELKHVHVARGEQVVLHDVSLRMDAGEHLAILGPNGCGKSTLLKAMTCELYPLVKPETSVRILGRERWDLTELKRRMGVVSPELPGRPTLHTTGFDAILTGFFSSSTLWPNLTVTAAMRERAEEIVAQVGAEGCAREAGGRDECRGAAAGDDWAGAGGGFGARRGADVVAG